MATDIRGTDERGGAPVAANEPAQGREGSDRLGAAAQAEAAAYDEHDHERISHSGDGFQERRDNLVE